jgi:hypothetical protein
LWFCRGGGLALFSPQKNRFVSAVEVRTLDHDHQDEEEESNQECWGVMMMVLMMMMMVLMMI